MGLSIGQSLGFFQPTRTAPQIQRAKTIPESSPRIGFSIDSEDTGRSNPFNRPKRTTVRVGFGEGTLSGPAAAIVALDRGLQSARRIVPPLPQENAGLRERIASQLTARTERKARAQTDQRANRIVAIATNQARNFINEINEVAGEALARIRGEDPSGTTGGTIEVGGQAFRFGAVGAASESVTFTDGGGRLRINTLV
jgi:hypothetical protein